MAFSELLAWEYEKARVLIEGVNLSVLLEGAHDRSTSGPVALIQYYCVYAWVFHFLHDKKAALKHAQDGLSFISESTTSVAEQDAYDYWEETLLFTLSVLLIDDRESALGVCSVFLGKHSSTFRPKDMLKAASILHRYLSILAAQLGEPQPLSGIPNFDTANLSRISTANEAAVKHIRQWLPVFEKVATQIYPFPQGENETDFLAARHRRVLRSYDWWVQIYMIAGKYNDDGPGDLIERHYKILEILYRGTTHSFHSLRLMRYICHSFFSLISISPDNVCQDEIIEARKAVKSYMFHWENKFTLLLDEKKKDQMAVLSKKTKRMSISQPYASHRLSGMITQAADHSVASFALGGVREEDESNDNAASAGGPVLINGMLPPIPPVSPFGRMTTRDEEDDIPFVVVGDVDGETVEDVIGVLITGMRLILLSCEGNVERLLKAANYGEKAFIILTEQGSKLANYKAMMAQVFRWLGAVNGEMALEMVVRKERTERQKEALLFLEKSKTMDRQNAQLRYQLALQLAEVGDVKNAIDEINKAIVLNPHCPNFYNLFALILSCENIDHALALANAGWVQCIKYQLELKKVSSEAQMTWENVDFTFRADLMNLRITILSLKMKKNGPQGMIESLQKTFGMLRRIVGVLPTYEDPQLNPEQPLSRRPSTGHQDRRRSLQVSNPANAKGFLSPIHKTSSTNLIAVTHRRGVYELQIGLWLTASSVYRELGMLQKSQHAVDEADKILEKLAQIQNRIRNQDSRLFRDEDLSVKTVQSSGGYWKEHDPLMKRIQADVALEKTMLQFTRCRNQNDAKPADPYVKYLSPVARVEAEKLASQRKAQRAAPRVGTNESTNISADSLSIVGTVQTEPIPIARTDSASEGINGSASIGHAAASEFPEEQDPSQLVTLEQVINTAQFALLLDVHHLPSRTFLGMLYREIGDLGQSEYHLQKACTQQKHRGTSSGRTGQASFFGGATSQWGWYGWHLLGLSLSDQGRLSEAAKASLYAVQLQRVSSVRGYESLPRF
ncbi:hypothetical protein HDV03_004307 [Kappamyces sp. JEL0829]|nr:hypothetical protein HDV03_004307 [Kappamyces sp. JEL0829]